MTSVCRIYAFLTIILAIIAITHVSAVPAVPELKLLHVVFRHGDRTPDFGGNELYPTDPYKNYKFFPMGLGQLTNNGKNREFSLGTVLRKRYNKFLGKLYLPESVVAHSSDYDRTKMSLQLLLAGLYPPEPIQQWNKDLKWQPIPYTYVPKVLDNLFLSDECPQFLEEYERVLSTPVVARKVDSYRDLMNFVTEKSGKNITTMLDIYYIYHTLMAESSMNLPIPEWTRGIFPYGALRDGTITGYDIANYNTKLRRLYAGHFLRLITENMKSCVNETLPQRRKIYLFSGHETNIASMLKCLNVFEPHTPQYSSAVILELYQLREHYYVKVNYYSGIPPVLRELRMPNCDTLCPLEKFLKLTADVIPSDEDLVCDKTKTAAYADTESASNKLDIAYNVIQV